MLFAMGRYMNEPLMLHWNSSSFVLKSIRSQHSIPFTNNTHVVGRIIDTVK